MKNIIVVLRMEYTGRHMVPLLEYIKAQGQHNPIVYYLPVCQNIKPLLDKKNIENYLYDYDWLEKNKPLSLIGKILGISGILGKSYELKRAKMIINQFKPGLILTPVSTQKLSRALIRRANKLGIPTLSIQRTTASQNDLWFKWLKRAEEQKGKDSKDIFSAWEFLKDIRRKLISLIDKWVSKVVGVEYRPPICLGDGEEKKFAIIGKSFREHFIREGLKNKELFSLVGHIEHDQFYENGVLNKEPTRSRLREKYGVKEGESIILICFMNRKLLRCPSLYESNSFMLRTVLETATKDSKVIIKYHPRSDGQEFDQGFLKDPRIIVDQDHDTLDVLCSCDYFISYNSAVNLNAIALDVPMLTINMERIFHQDMCEHLGGGIHVRYQSELKEELERLLFDKTTQDYLAHQRQLSRQRWMICDGKVKERIYQLINELIDKR